VYEDPKKMFKYDKDYYNNNQVICSKFLFKFLWRWILLNLLITLPFGVGLTYLTTNSGIEFLYALMLFNVLIGFIPTYLTFHLIQYSQYKGTGIEYKISGGDVSSRSQCLIKISIAFYWRFISCAFGLQILLYLFIQVFKVSAPQLGTIIGMIAVWLAWYWFVLFNDKTGSYIQFTRDEF